MSSFRVFGVFRGSILSCWWLPTEEIFYHGILGTHRKSTGKLQRLTLLERLKANEATHFKWTNRRTAFDQTPYGLGYKPTGRVPFDRGSLGDAQGSSGSSPVPQTLEVRIWKRD